MAFDWYCNGYCYFTRILWEGLTMDAQAIQMLIGSVGFPIFAYVYHMMTMQKTLETNTKIMIRLEKYMDDNDEKQGVTHE